MRILIDECLDWRLARALPGHDVTSVPKQGWAGIKNGKLLALAARSFDVFLTADRNLTFQQNRARLPITVVVLSAPSIRLRDTLPLMPEVLAALIGSQHGEIICIPRGVT